MLTEEKKQKRIGVLEYFRKVARDKNTEIQQKAVEFEDLLNTDDKGRRIIFIIPESIGDVYLCTSLFQSINVLYPNHNLYVATKPENFEILEGNPYVHKVLVYTPQMDNHFWLTGLGGHKGYFEVAYHPYFGTQRLIDYINNGNDKIALNLNL